MAVKAEWDCSRSRGTQCAGPGVADVYVLHLWTDLQSLIVEQEKLQACLYDPDCSLVYVWKYLTVYNRDICNDEDLAGEGNDGRDGYSCTVFVSDVSGAGKCQQGNVDAVHLCMHVGSLCHEYILYDHSNRCRRRVRDVWNQEKEREVCGRNVSVLHTLSGVGSVLSDRKMIVQYEGGGINGVK